MTRSFLLASFLIAPSSSTAQLDGTPTIDDANGDVPVASGCLTFPGRTTRPASR